MRPVFLITFAGFAVGASLSATRAHAACAVDSDCLDNGDICGTDVCNRSGTCVPAGTDPGTCNSISNCKCYGLYSVLCNPQSHSCTVTNADGGMNIGGSGGGGVSEGGGGYFPEEAGTTMGEDDAGSAAADNDAESSQGSGGGTAGTSAAGSPSGTVTGNAGSGNAATSSSGASNSNGGEGAGASRGAGSGASSATPPKSSSGCSVGVGDEPTGPGLFGIALGACALVGRRRPRPSPPSVGSRSPIGPQSPLADPR